MRNGRGTAPVMSTREDAILDLRKTVDKILDYLEEQDRKTPDDPRMIRRKAVVRVGPKTA
jgi:hypothetical protein